MDIQIGLTAGCHTVQENDILALRPKSLDFIGSFRLGIR